MNKTEENVVLAFNAKSILKDQNDLLNLKNTITSCISINNNITQLESSNKENLSGIMILDIDYNPEENFSKRLIIYEDLEVFKTADKKNIYYAHSIDIFMQAIYSTNYDQIKNILKKYYYSPIK